MYVYKSLWFFMYTYVYTYSNDNTHIIYLYLVDLFWCFCNPTMTCMFKIPLHLFHFYRFGEYFPLAIGSKYFPFENTKKIPAKRIFFFKYSLVRCNNGRWCFICFWRCNRRRWDLMFLGNPVISTLSISICSVAIVEGANDAVLNQNNYWVVLVQHQPMAG